MRKGFTLIELLVVISILGLMSSIAFASLNSARGRAKDASIKSSLLQIRTIYNQEFSDRGSFSGLTTGWSQTNCSHIIPSNFPNAAASSVDKIREICTSVIEKYGGSDSCPNFGTSNLYCVYLSSANGGNPNQFSLMAWLPGAEKYMCLGSSGRSSYEEDSTQAWNDPGCWNNP